jgi:hypothetical protein
MSKRYLNHGSLIVFYNPPSTENGKHCHFTSSTAMSLKVKTAVMENVVERAEPVSLYFVQNSIAHNSILNPLKPKLV